MVESTTEADDAGRAEIEAVLAELMAIRSEMTGDAAGAQRRVRDVHSNYRQSASNLLHYLALRRGDRRALQLRLAALGLSSLGRAETNVLATIETVLGVLHRLLNRPWQPPERDTVVDFAGGQRLLAEHTDALLGPAPTERWVRIMVTMPSEAADDYDLVHDLLEQGMNCMRINCAHDDAAVWSRMIDNLRRAEHALGRRCRVVMDLAGPKLRTGPVEPRPAVVRIRPHHDRYGRVTAAARIWLSAEACCRQPPSPADARLPVPATWLASLRTGQRVSLTDARDADRILTVVEVTDRGCWAEASKGAYIVAGTVLHRDTAMDDDDGREASVGPLPPCENFISLQCGDSLVVTRDLHPGRPATRDSENCILSPAVIGCTLPAVFDDVQAGESIWFDDGKIGGVVDKMESDRVLVRITHARMRGEKLRGDKGINLPESDLRLPAMSAKDIEDLSFAARHADVIELSFANAVADVESLQQRLAELGGQQVAIVLKIETRRGFENLPEMLLAAMRSPCCGVMIARGDLAVECGFERLAEVQEEILWICEAAHVPVIWATQVLETLAKDGMPSRAEITDAAMGDRAECVMLNKGPHMVSAVRVLDDILRRMQEHQTKKRSMLRELRLAHGLSAAPDAHSASTR